MPGKSILITGCSSGIGLCAALTLKERGYRVFATARKGADVEKLIAAGFESTQMDLNHSDSIERGLEYVLTATGGTLDALFNNSGYMQAGAIEDLSNEIIRQQFETNTFGPINLTQLVLPIMRSQGHGRIIQNSSILGVITMPYYGAYNASKFALEGFSSSLRQELRNTNIRVSIINPGPITSQLRNNAYQHYQNILSKQQTGLHEKIYQNLEKSYFKPSKHDQRITLGPDAVVKELIHALESKHPKAHYFIGTPAKTLAILRRMLPDCALDWIISKIR